MLNISEYVAVFPRIVPSGHESMITVMPKYNFITLQDEYKIAVLPRYRFESHDRAAEYDYQPVAATDGKLTFTWHFEEEQEYIVYIIPSDESASKCIIASLYALDHDLYGKKAIKGDLHLHTTYSDGIESPEFCVARARLNGFDFLAITDHDNYNGSLRALDIMKRCGNPLTIVRGEEVHPDYCPIHILSLGAKAAVSPVVKKSNPALETMLQKIISQWKDDLPQDVDQHSFAAAVLALNQIHESEGISVLCHIYWDAVKMDRQLRLATPEQLITAVVQLGLADAYELISGAPYHDRSANYLQEAYYREHFPSNFPIIGITDSHSTLPKNGSIFGKNYTIALADEVSEAGILNAIRNYRTVAVESVTGSPNCHGSLRLCKFAAFLLKEYFPVHDAIVAVEGDIMQKLIMGIISEPETLTDIHNANAEYLQNEWVPICP